MTETSDTDDPSYANALAKLIRGWSWTWKYSDVLEQHMHAIGVISANYNDMEFSLFFMFYHYMNDQQSRVPELLFGRIDNARRLEYLRQYCDAYESPGPVRDTAHNFLDGYEICADNRNALMHSSVRNEKNLLNADKPELVLAQRSKKNFSSQTIRSVGVEKLRKVADEIFAYDNLGFKLSTYLTARRRGGVMTLGGKEVRPELPAMISLPEKLALLPSIAM